MWEEAFVSNNVFFERCFQMGQRVVVEVLQKTEGFSRGGAKSQNHPSIAATEGAR